MVVSPPNEVDDTLCTNRIPLPPTAMTDRIGERVDEPAAAPTLRASPDIQAIIDENEDWFGTPGVEGRMAIENIESSLLEERIDGLKEELTTREFDMSEAFDAQNDTALQQAEANVRALTACIAHLENVMRDVQAFELTLE